jgi:hypothetical protein
MKAGDPSRTPELGARVGGTVREGAQERDSGHGTGGEAPEGSGGAALMRCQGRGPSRRFVPFPQCALYAITATTESPGKPWRHLNRRNIWRV